MADYPVAIRLSKFDRANSQWDQWYQIDGQYVKDLECSFLGNRIEDFASMRISDRGSIAQKYTETNAEIADATLWIISSDADTPVDVTATYPPIPKWGKQPAKTWQLPTDSGASASAFFDGGGGENWPASGTSITFRCCVRQPSPSTADDFAIDFLREGGRVSNGEAETFTWDANGDLTSDGSATITRMGETSDWHYIEKTWTVSGVADGTLRWVRFLVPISTPYASQSILVSAFEWIDAQVETVKLSTVVASLETEIDPLLRLDIRAPHREFQTDEDVGQGPDPGFGDLPIYWSGYVTRRQWDRKDERRELRLEAQGWTGYLRKIPIQRQFYRNKTVIGVLRELVNDYVKPRFPSSVDGMDILARGTIGSDGNFIIPEIGWENTDFLTIVEELASFSYFNFGISVSGWPSQTNQEYEFRLNFFEPSRFTLGVAYPPTGVDGGWDSSMSFDVDNDPRIVEFSEEINDESYANSWYLQGEPLHVDIMSVVSGNDASRVYDRFIGSPSGAFFFQPFGWAGWDIVITDLAKRNWHRDPETGIVYSAGRIAPVPPGIEKLDGDSVFRVFNYTEQNNTAVYDVSQFPGRGINTLKDLTFEALRYILRPRGSTVLRTFLDTRDADSDAREEIVRVASVPTMRGFLHGAIFASTDRQAERFESRSATLTVKGIRLMPNGITGVGPNGIGIRQSGDRLTRLGTAVNGGDEWSKGDDNRAVGPSKVYEIRKATCRFDNEESGWTIIYDLAASPRQLEAIVFPGKIFGKGGIGDG